MQQQHYDNSLSTALSSFAPTAYVMYPAQGELEELPETVLNRIADYLDHVCAPLVTDVPFDTRREWRGEMQTHLESLTLAHIELGDAPDVAIERALAQFGASEVLSKQWRQEWEQTGHSQAFGPSLQVARQWYGGAVGLTMALLLVTGDLANQGGRGAHIANLLFMLTPLVVGVGIGRSVKYPVKATLAALKRFALPLLLTYVTVFTYAKGWHNIPDWHGVPAGLNAIGMCVRYGGDYGVVVGSIITLLQLVCWAVLGVPAAFVTHYAHHTLLPRLRRRLAR